MCSVSFVREARGSPTAVQADQSGLQRSIRRKESESEEVEKRRETGRRPTGCLTVALKGTRVPCRIPHSPSTVCTYQVNHTKMTANRSRQDIATLFSDEGNMTLILSRESATQVDSAYTQWLGKTFSLQASDGENAVEGSWHIDWEKHPAEIISDGITLYPGSALEAVTAIADTAHKFNEVVPGCQRPQSVLEKHVREAAAGVFSAGFTTALSKPCVILLLYCIVVPVKTDEQWLELEMARRQITLSQAGRQSRKKARC
jgi:hypothetical protein